MPNVPTKHSIVFRGRKTSVSLEAPFWAALQKIATERRWTISEAVAFISEQRESPNLSSAIRVCRTRSGLRGAKPKPIGDACPVIMNAGRSGTGRLPIIRPVSVLPRRLPQKKALREARYGLKAAARPCRRRSVHRGQTRCGILRSWPSST
jgi:predicted DNA-binding ribbon-helix-helix protein